MARLSDPGARMPGARFADGAPDWLAPSLRNCSRCGDALAYGPGAGRGPPAACLHRLRQRDLREPAPRRDDPAGHRLGRARPHPPRHPRRVTVTGPSRAASLRPMRRSSRAPSARRARRPASSSSRPRSWASTPGRRPPSSVVAFEARHRRRHDGRRPRSRSRCGSFSVDDIPWAGLAFDTTLWAVRDWVAASASRSRRGPAGQRVA